MDQLPCSTSLLMTVNFDGLKSVIDFLHSSILALNEKTADLTQKFSSFEETKNKLNEFETSLKVINNFESKINMFEDNITQIDERIKDIENNNNDINKNYDPNVLLDKNKDPQETINQLDKIVRGNLSALERKFNQLNNKVNSLSKRINNNEKEESNDISNINDKSQDLLDVNNQSLERRITKIEKTIKQIIESNKIKDIDESLNFFEKQINSEEEAEKSKRKLTENKEITNKTNEEQILENQKLSSDRNENEQDKSKKNDKYKNQISEFLNNMRTNPFLKQKDFIVYSNKMDSDFKSLTEEIENLKSIIENQNKTNNIKNTNDEFGSEMNKDTIKLMATDLMNNLEKKNHDSIIKYVSHLDLSTNPLLVEINTKILNNKNSIKNINEKLKEIEENLDKCLKGNGPQMCEEVEKLKQQNLSFGRDLKDKGEKLTFLQKKINYLSLMINGADEIQNESDLNEDTQTIMGNSIKEEIKIHNDYLKKLSEGINKVNSRIDNLNKETLLMIKKDLKNDSNFVLEEFKNGLKTTLGKIKFELKEKVDKLGLDEFRNQMNNQFLSEIKGKIDKKEMDRNNIIINKKIDTLEGKISRTLVDTLIDLQMDENPLVVKRSFKELGVQKCAACNQTLPFTDRIMGFNLGSGSSANMNMGVMNSTAGSSNFKKVTKQKINVAGEKKEGKLPEIKQSGYNI